MRDKSIEYLKFLAILLITNSHFDVMYVAPFQKLSTGGAIGDALFFFCSGYTLALGRIDDFLSWFRRRVVRIYPSIICIAIVSSLIFGKHISWKSFVFGGGWFVQCIMIYYVLIYVILRWFRVYLKTALLLLLALTVALFFLFDRHDLFIYGESYFKWVFYFGFVLMGAYANGRGWFKNLEVKYAILFSVLGVVAFYGIQMASHKVGWWFQLLSLVPLLAVVIFFRVFFANVNISRIIDGSRASYVMEYIAGMSLEIYLVQMLVITDRWNSIFPANLVLVFSLILALAYLLKMLSKCFLWLFSTSISVGKG